VVRSCHFLKRLARSESARSPLGPWASVPPRWSPVETCGIPRRCGPHRPVLWVSPMVLATRGRRIPKKSTFRRIRKARGNTRLRDDHDADGRCSWTNSDPPPEVRTEPANRGRNHWVFRLLDRKTALIFMIFLRQRGPQLPRASLQVERCATCRTPGYPGWVRRLDPLNAEWASSGCLRGSRRPRGETQARKPNRRLYSHRIPPP